MSTNSIQAIASNPYIKDLDEYRKLYDESINNPKDFFKKMATENLSWIKDFDEVHNSKFANTEWFKNGKINVSENCLDRHLEDRSEKTALIWEGDEPQDNRKITYAQLHASVCRLANGLKSRNIKKGASSAFLPCKYSIARS